MPTILIIRDGWGENPNTAHDAFNAVHLADTPVDNRLRSQYPRMLIKTCGIAVGLPPGVMGNSEVGHQNIGAGRVVNQELRRISESIEDGRFFQNQALRAACAHAVDNNRNLHVLGLVSDGRVHSDLGHLFALIELAAREGVPSDRVFIHVITDGRDTGPNTGLGFIDQLQEQLDHGARGRIASLIGRYWAMDRDHRWQRTARAYECLTGRNVRHPLLHQTPVVQRARSAQQVLHDYYAHPLDHNRQGDEFVPPTQFCDEHHAPIGLIADGDAVIFFNFRGDRPRQITRAFVLDDRAWTNVKGGGFDRRERLDNLCFCTMTAYETGLDVSAAAFQKPPRMPDILGEIISNHSLTQFRCAETEKFAHVTFFFNDYREEPFPGEHRVLVPSPQDVSTYDQKPQMSAPEVCSAVIERLEANDCEDLIVVNFANPDMVGHTGNLNAVVAAVETVDACVGQIINAAIERNANLIITADHGNAEQMWNPETESPHTAHTTYDVPLYIVDQNLRSTQLRHDGALADVAPTILRLMGINQPPAMTGRSLIM